MHLIVYSAFVVLRFSFILISMSQGISWAARRRAIVIIILAIFVSAGILFLHRTITYRAQTCTDGIKDQNETGIDCGGVCTYLCPSQIQQPVVQFVRAIPNGGGRTDIIAYVENPNSSSAVSNAPYTIDMYGQEGTVIATRSGLVTLAPHVITPIYIPGVAYGPVKIVNAFLSFDTNKMHWFKRTTPRQLLPFSNIRVTQGTVPHINATITNPSTTIYRNLKVVISVFDSSNNIIAVSQTIVPELYGLGAAPLTFTWSSPFSKPPVREDLFYIVALDGK